MDNDLKSKVQYQRRLARNSKSCFSELDGKMPISPHLFAVHNLVVIRPPALALSPCLFDLLLLRNHPFVFCLSAFFLTVNTTRRSPRFIHSFLLILVWFVQQDLSGIRGVTHSHSSRNRLSAAVSRSSPPQQVLGRRKRNAIKSLLDSFAWHM